MPQLETVQALHHELVSLRQHRLDNLPAVDELLEGQRAAFRNFLDKKARDAVSRKAVSSGRFEIDGEQYSAQPEFIENVLRLADEVDQDELETAKLLLDAEEEGDRDVHDRSLFECGIIRFHQQRNYLLDCMRLCIEIANDDELEDAIRLGFRDVVEHDIYRSQVQDDGRQKIVPRCIAAMQAIKAWLQQISDKVAALSVVSQAGSAEPHEFQEVIELSRLSLVQQHELLAVIVSTAINEGKVETKDFQDFLLVLKKADKYDHMLCKFLGHTTHWGKC
jgi:nuclear pore complex protein Nup205